MLHRDSWAIYRGPPSSIDAVSSGINDPPAASLTSKDCRLCYVSSPGMLGAARQVTPRQAAKMRGLRE
jgi:hypothetical protein